MLKQLPNAFSNLFTFVTIFLAVQEEGPDNAKPRGVPAVFLMRILKKEKSFPPRKILNIIQDLSSNFLTCVFCIQ